MRSFERQTAKAFADYLSSQWMEMRVLSSDGFPIIRMELDTQRVNDTSEMAYLVTAVRFHGGQGVESDAPL